MSLKYNLFKFKLMLIYNWLKVKTVLYGFN